MTAFSQQSDANADANFDTNPAKRRSRWAISNWTVRWKVFAIVLVPLLLAGAFGGLRIYSGWNEAEDLRLAADRTEMVPAIEGYTAALEGALLANSSGGDAQAALTAFDTSKQNLAGRLADTDVVPDVRAGVTSLLDGGQALLDQVTANSIGLPERVNAYAPILVTAEDAVNGSVRVDDEKTRADTLGLSRAMAARGEVMMQQLLVNLGGEIPEPELRTSMITLAGTEPSTLFGMSQVLGVGSPDALKLQAELDKRTALMSDPAVPLVNNPELTASLEATSDVAREVIGSTTADVTSSVDDQASATRAAAIRDSAVVGAAMLLALLVVALMARTLIRPLRRLRDGALKVAHEDLVRELDLVRAGGDPGPVQPLPVHSTEEVGQVAHAVDELHEQALLIAGEQARLQVQVGDMFETLSRRSRSLVDQQLSLIDRLERNEEDPERLESLFRLDHLAARMRRNGANLLVLAGSRMPRERAESVAIAALVNAAASEVEDYARVATAIVPDSEVLGVVAADLVHLLAELFDNALRYSPPISQVQVSAMHTGNGGLVIEVSDTGLGMTESDLRVANTRLQSGGEVNPYTARHMGLFVVGRLAAVHGLVVRLRSTVAGEPNSGTTAGVYVPAELLLRGDAPIPADAPDAVADTHASVASAMFEDDHAGDGNGYGYGQEVADAEEQDYRNGHVGVSFLPQRKPGASGISDIPTAEPSEFAEPALEPTSGWQEDEWPEDSMPAQSADPRQPESWRPPQEWPPPVAPPRQTPADTSAFFAARARPVVPTNGPYPPVAPEDDPVPQASRPVDVSEVTAAPVAAQKANAAAASGGGGIFEEMLSEWLIDDPNALADSTDLDWQTVWDRGWSAAAAADTAPVAEHTEHGLPVRQPGARLVPGAAEGGEEAGNGRHRNGSNGYSNGGADDDPDTGPLAVSARDPEAVRDNIAKHFGGVNAGRNQVRDGGETDRE